MMFIFIFCGTGTCLEGRVPVLLYFYAYLYLLYPHTQRLMQHRVSIRQPVFLTTVGDGFPVSSNLPIFIPYSCCSLTSAPKPQPSLSREGEPPLMLRYREALQGFHFQWLYEPAMVDTFYW